MTSEIRDYGDEKQIVLHTTNNATYQRLKGSVKVIKQVDYEQEQKKKVALVGVDLYFPKRYGKWLERQIAGE